jgi:hypothetical protein
MLIQVDRLFVHYFRLSAKIKSYGRAKSLLAIKVSGALNVPCQAQPTEAGSTSQSSRFWLESNRHEFEDPGRLVRAASAGLLACNLSFLHARGTMTPLVSLSKAGVGEQKSVETRVAGEGLSWEPFPLVFRPWYHQSAGIRRRDPFYSNASAARMLAVVPTLRGFNSSPAVLSRNADV